MGKHEIQSNNRPVILWLFLEDLNFRGNNQETDWYLIYACDSAADLSNSTFDEETGSVTIVSRVTAFEKKCVRIVATWRNGRENSSDRNLAETSSPLCCCNKCKRVLETRP